MHCLDMSSFGPVWNSILYQTQKLSDDLQTRVSELQPSPYVNVAEGKL